MRIVLDRRVRWLSTHRLLSPTGRLLQLGPGGPQALQAALRGAGDAKVDALARQLVEAGAAHPIVAATSPSDVTVVIPVRDRIEALSRCLAALDHDDVLVIDDGSENAEALEHLCRAHGARLVRRSGGGPAAARNTSLPLLRREIVAFLDSDCEAPPGWLHALRGHFDDPNVAAVAPRVTGGPRSPLDLGPDPAAVRPGTAVGHVPTAALLVRRSAMRPFDEGLRYGEDVDLVWWLIEQGWTVRYDPSVSVQHAEPATLGARLLRRFHYGTSAAPLSARHPGQLTHLVLPPWPTAVLSLLVTGRPLLAAGAAAAATVRVNRQVQQVPASARLIVATTTGTALGVGRALALLGPPVWLAARRRPALAALLVAPVVSEWLQRRPGIGLIPFAARSFSDQAAYGAGVITGCLKERTMAPLVPRLRRPNTTRTRRRRT